MQINSEQELKKQMRRLKIYAHDIKETFIRSSGPGGQNVNKVSTCVYLIHRPTGMSVKCQKERTQALNRFRARCLLVQKIDKKKREEEFKAKQKKEKNKRRNRKRPKALKERILQDKRQTSEKKKIRRKVRLSDIDRL